MISIIALCSGDAAFANGGGARATATVSVQIIAPARITADQLRADAIAVGGDALRISRGSAHLPANSDSDAIDLPLIEFH
jgi:hypothetical protein